MCVWHLQATKLYLVSRQQSDPLATDENASQRQFRAAFGPKSSGNIPSDFPQDLLQDGEYDDAGGDSNDGIFSMYLTPEMERERNEILAKIGRPNPNANSLPHDYDYTKHMRPMGGGVFVPATNSSVPADLRTGPMKITNEDEFWAKLVVPDEDTPATGIAAAPTIPAKPVGPAPIHKKVVSVTTPDASGAVHTASVKVASTTVIFDHKKTKRGIIAPGVGRVDDMLQGLEENDRDYDSGDDQPTTKPQPKSKPTPTQTATATTAKPQKAAAANDKKSSAPAAAFAAPSDDADFPDDFLNRANQPEPELARSKPSAAAAMKKKPWQLSHQEQDDYNVWNTHRLEIAIAIAIAAVGVIYQF